MLCNPWYQLRKRMYVYIPACHCFFRNKTAPGRNRYAATLIPKDCTECICTDWPFQVIFLLEPAARFRTTHPQKPAYIMSCNRKPWSGTQDRNAMDNSTACESFARLGTYPRDPSYLHSIESLAFLLFCYATVLYSEVDTRVSCLQSRRLARFAMAHPGRT